MFLHKLMDYSILHPTLDRQWEELLRFLGPAVGDGAPSGTIEPRYIGDEYFDITNNLWYKANGATVNSWVTFASMVHAHTGADVTYIDTVDAVQRKIITESGVITTEEQ